MSTEVLVVGIGLAVYFVGFIVAGVIEQRLCDYRPHDDCNHPWKGPEPTFWPVVALLLLVVGPYLVAGRASRWLATRETPSERRDRLAVARDEMVRAQAQRIEELEREVGIS